jgi:hypothetical protein
MSDRSEFRIGHYLRGMEEILKSFRGPLTVKYWTNTTHEEPYNNSNGQTRTKPLRMVDRPETGRRLRHRPPLQREKT